MTFDEVRRVAIQAMFADDSLMNQLVLKGGNALNLVHRIGSRFSFDLDFSAEGDFPDISEVKNRIFRALGDRFDSAGFLAFDLKFEEVPMLSELARRPHWGGYRIEFKLIEHVRFTQLGADLAAARREATLVGPLQRRVFTIQISTYEFCSNRVEVDLGDYRILVYSPLMIAVEKLRAICQQMPAYRVRRAKTPRARDFYDIVHIMDDGRVDLRSSDSLELVRASFLAKEVPLMLLGRIAETREFHRQDWPSVEVSVAGKLPSFDDHFDRVLALCSSLEPLWNE